MRGVRVSLALVAAFLGAAGEPVVPEPVELPAGVAPFGLSCSECSLAAEAACSALWISPVVAEARGARIASANRQCYKVPRQDGTGSTETCDIVESVTFERLRYFRAPPEHFPDRFRVVHSTGDVHADEAGIALSSGRRYVLFAEPSDGALTVTAACPVEDSRELK
jgi:hypothetical protein